MQTELDNLLSLDPNSLTDDEAIDRIGQLIDLAAELQDEKALHSSLVWCEMAHQRGLSHTHRSVLHYFQANAWSALIAIRQNASLDQLDWSGETSEWSEKEVISLRRSRNGEGFQSLPDNARCRVLTNLGCALDRLGRFSEAVECLDEAIDIDRLFGMAWGNRGIALTSYARGLPHLPHAPGLCSTTAFLKEALGSLELALALTLDPGSEKSFEKYRSFLAERRGEDHEPLIDLDSPSLGESEAEQAYRGWSLSHRLFINPLNDLGNLSAAALDVLHLPAITVSINTGPYYESFFNQMKQEFVSARFLFYEGITATSPHFSDSGVTLYDTTDYPVFGLSIERVKLALRSTYSLFDKMAFFLNYYLQLGIPAKQVNFRSFWYKSQNPKQGLKADIDGRCNWALRGMFWLAKDLYDSRPEFRDAMEPEAREIDVIRNHAEHKLLRVHEFPENTAWARGTMPDEALFSIDRDGLYSRTMRMLKLTRSALVYLAYAVHIEEMRKQQARGSDEKIMNLEIEWIDDGRKR